MEGMLCQVTMLHEAHSYTRMIMGIVAAKHLGLLASSARDHRAFTEKSVERKVRSSRELQGGNTFIGKRLS